MADSVYWSSFADGAIRGAPLAGGGPVDTLYDRVHGAMGPRAVAIDAAAGRIYWTNQGDLSIRGAPLAGGTDDRLYGPGQAVGISSGLAIDLAWPPRMYWTNEIDDSIKEAPLAGGGTVQSLYYGAPGVNNPAGVAIDRAAGRIYWANFGDNTIRRGPLAGGAAGTLYGPTHGVSGPNGVAIDLVAGMIYWANFLDDTIRVAPLDGSGSGRILYGPTHGVSRPVGVAIDPPDAVRLVLVSPERSQWAVVGWLDVAVRWILDRITGRPDRSGDGRIYWANSGDNTIRGAPLSGGPPGIVDTLYSGPAEGVYWPNYLAVLRAPVGTAAPTISGPRNVGQPLSCSRGVWAPDLPGSSLYRAPQSFKYRWLRNGAPVGMLSFATYTPTSAGSYACEVTGTNVAGSATQASATVAVP